MEKRIPELSKSFIVKIVIDAKKGIREEDIGREAALLAVSAWEDVEYIFNGKRNRIDIVDIVGLFR